MLTPQLKALTLLHDLLEEDGEGAVGGGLRGAGLCAVWDQVSRKCPLKH